MTRRGILTIACTLCAGVAMAQTPAVPGNSTPPPPWSGSTAAGIALTSGNTKTTTFNLAFGALRDAKAKHVVSFDGLYLRGSNEDVLNVNRVALGGRHQYALAPRAYVFEQIQYFRDPFKGVRYLLSPTAGIGYKVVARPATQLSVDGGVGVSIEGRPVDVRDTNGAVSGNQKFTHQLSTGTVLTQSASGLWRMNDPGDALYAFSAGVAMGLTPRSQLKVELLDTYKSRPPSAAFKKNDVAIVTSIAFKY